MLTIKKKTLCLPFAQDDTETERAGANIAASLSSRFFFRSVFQARDVVVSLICDYCFPHRVLVLRRLSSSHKGITHLFILCVYSLSCFSRVTLPCVSHLLKLRDNKWRNHKKKKKLFFLVVPALEAVIDPMRLLSTRQPI